MNQKTEQILYSDLKDCSGCNACGDICNHNAIIFQTDLEGFWYPEIDKDKCTDCGLCEKVCPIINIQSLKKNDLEQSVCYAAEHKDLEVVFDSTSGGAFSALADVMYKENGYVGGALFNDDFSIKHYISNNPQDLVKLRSSKYAESDLSGFYKKVKILLKADKKVLVCGCPCQMAALRAFLKKDYENLIIADFICRGINSPQVWRKYLDSFEERYGSPVVYVKAKSKEYGWRNLTQKVILANGKSIYETKDVSNFMKGYLQTNIYCRPSCYDCKFKGFPRISDITLADYWGIERIDKSMEKDLGISLVMLNSKKGLEFFEKVKPQMNLVHTPFDAIFADNMALIKSLPQPSINRTLFFEDLDKKTFTEVAAKYINNTVSVKVKLRKVLKRLHSIYQCTIRLGIKPLFQVLKYNKLKDILKLHLMLPTSYCIIDIHRTATLKFNGVFSLGIKRIKKSKLETRLLIEAGAMLEVENDFSAMYGADIEIFKNASLKFGGKGYSNINCTIICAEKIEIGKDVIIGRNVTIRDNNGGHYINRLNYKNSKPITIEDKVWLGDGCIIMPGVTIGEGSVIAARTVVTKDIPPHSLAVGTPAHVIDKNILWKK